MCQNCEYQEYIDKIQDMLEYDEYNFASDTLENILEWVQEKQHITAKQKQAVDNIEASREI